MLIEHEVSCPSCKFLQQAELWSSITVKEDPELKDLLMGGEINFLECQSCKAIFYAEQFILYHDQIDELFAFVYPSGHETEKEKWLEKSRLDFQKAQENLDAASKFRYVPHSFFGLQDLITQVRLEEDRKLQGEIAACLAKPLGLEIKKIRPSLARAQAIPPVLPFNKKLKGSFREQLISAIEMIEKKNDLLFHYRELKNKLLQDKEWSLNV